MANSKITWTDKESLVTDPTIAEKNKVTDSNMNEIKSVVNENADQVIVSDTGPTSANNEIWVDTSSNATYINSEISNEYGTSQNLGYSQEYINGNNTPVPIPNSAFTNLLTGTIDTNHSFTIGNAVFINIRISGATKPANGWKTLLNIAEAYRPTSEAHPIIQVPYTQLKLNSAIYNNGDIGINEQSDSWGSNIINIFAIYYK